MAGRHFWLTLQSTGIWVAPWYFVVRRPARISHRNMSFLCVEELQNELAYSISRRRTLTIDQRSLTACSPSIRLSSKQLVQRIVRRCRSRGRGAQPGSRRAAGRFLDSTGNRLEWRLARSCWIGGLGPLSAYLCRTPSSGRWGQQLLAAAGPSSATSKLPSEKQAARSSAITLRHRSLGPGHVRFGQTSKHLVTCNMRGGGGGGVAMTDTRSGRKPRRSACHRHRPSAAPSRPVSQL